VDLHYRLSFQLLAENPGLFFASSLHPLARLQQNPLVYQGAALRYTAGRPESSRLLCALLPYLEKLAISHGELLDRFKPLAAEVVTNTTMRQLGSEDLTARSFAGRDDAFLGFQAVDGWEPEEGPVPEVYLPRFHWGLAPATHLLVPSVAPRIARIAIEARTYSAGQKIELELNGKPVLQHSFAAMDQQERINCLLHLQAGENQLVLRYERFLQTAQDPRKLAVIYLSIRIN
jgi:hypothetical protein